MRSQTAPHSATGLKDSIAFHKIHFIINVCQAEFAKERLPTEDPSHVPVLVPPPRDPATDNPPTQLPTELPTELPTGPPVAKPKVVKPPAWAVGTRMPKMPSPPTSPPPPEALMQGGWTPPPVQAPVGDSDAAASSDRPAAPKPPGPQKAGPRPPGLRKPDDKPPSSGEAPKNLETTSKFSGKRPSSGESQQKKRAPSLQLCLRKSQLTC